MINKGDLIRVNYSSYEDIIDQFFLVDGIDGDGGIFIELPSQCSIWLAPGEFELVWKA